MTRPGTEAQPLRVAIIGSGPAGFYTAEKLLGQEGLVVQVDMYDRLPVPFGLVRFGVAPDREKIKNVTSAFEKVAASPRFRFYGNVEVGTHITLNDLRLHYHQVCCATGAQTDRRMGIPGEDLERSHPATQFVAWYNGHPDYRDCEFDLSVRRVAVVGAGNVALDVARVLCRTPEELATTDCAERAAEALANSNVKEIYLIGRRGPAQAAFTNPELRELGELPGADVVVLPEEVQLDAVSQAALDQRRDREVVKKLEILQGFAGRPGSGKPKKLTLRFLVSPVELCGNDAGQVTGMLLVRNELYLSEDGSLRPRPTARYEELPVELVFRAVGQKGEPLAGLPFDERRAIVPNEKGRVFDLETGRPLPGLYVAGWIKRDAVGFIGTNKPDAGETVACMLEDAAAGVLLNPARPDPAQTEELVRSNQPDIVSWTDWQRIQELEEARGSEQGRPRVKFTSVEELLAALKSR
ncbi:MAG: FAD-dependent oxidoreductase [Gemmatimonadota bacterium]|nr:MAG: FAD-dependent oxidoreductase [Gemmatimonadota bacterium]